MVGYPINIGTTSIVGRRKKREINEGCEINCKRNYDAMLAESSDQIIIVADVYKKCLDDCK